MKFPTCLLCSPKLARNLYSNYLNTGLVWYSNGRFVSGRQTVRDLKDGLTTRLKKVCLWSKMSDIQLVHQVT